MQQDSSVIESFPRDRSVEAEFPRDLLSLLRCSRDAGTLDSAERRGTETGVIEARLKCVTCGAEFQVEGGIARMMIGELTEEDEHEIAIRQQDYSAAPDVWYWEVTDQIALSRYLGELEPLEERRTIEIGCGDGRATFSMAHLGARIIAVDFSIEALRNLAWRLRSGVAPSRYVPARQRPLDDLRGRIGLVQADASRFRVAPVSFDRAISFTPLDSYTERARMYSAIAEGLKDDGRYIVTLEHDDLIRRLLGLPLGRRYSPGGIYIEHFEPKTLHREIAPYFETFRSWPVRPFVPFARGRLSPTSFLWLSRLVSRTPILRQLGEIIMLRAERPLRPTREGVNRPGNPVLKALYRWYSRRIGKESAWGHEPV